jgi:hypothetical protein
METPDKNAAEIVKKLKAQHPDLNEEDFTPHTVSDSGSIPPSAATGESTDNPHPDKGPNGLISF